MNNLFDEALAAHSAGNVQKAAKVYRQILAIEPSHAPSLHYLGVVAHQLNQNDEAIRLMSLALESESGVAAYHSNLGAVFRVENRPADAVQCFENAVAIAPHDPNSYFNLGCAHQDLEQWMESLRNFNRAIELQSGHRRAHLSRATVLRRLGRVEEALSLILDFLDLHPSDAEIINDVGVSILRLKRFEDAKRRFQEALLADRNCRPAARNLARTHGFLGNHAIAIELFDSLIETDPTDVECILRKGESLHYSGQFDEALGCFQAAVNLNASSADAHLALALASLLTGDLERGWREYEWRFKTNAHGISTKCKPRWNGELVDGRTLMLFAEQGVGDAVQFIRYAKLLTDQGARVMVHCQPSLVPILGTADGVDAVFARGSELPFFDFGVPLMSIPHIVGTTLESIPDRTPYLRVESERKLRWKSVLDRIGGIRVGLFWQGNPDNARDHLRSIPLCDFEPLFELEGVSLISLQKGVGREQIRQSPEARIQDFMDEVDLDAPFIDTVSIIEQLDLMIAIDSSVAHIAGACGIPTWILLPKVPDFRWMLERTDSPWYPSVRLFRQEHNEAAWESVILKVQTELKQFDSRRTALSQ